MRIIVSLLLACVSVAGQAQTVVSSLPGRTALTAGWNLVGNDSNKSIDPVAAFGSPAAPVTGVTENIASVWQWNAGAGTWAFFAPSMDAAALSAYATQKNYAVISQIAKGEGFWINAKNPFTITFAYDAATAIPYAIAAHDVSGNCTLYDSSFVGVLTPSAQAKVYDSLFVGGVAVKLTVPGSTTLDYSYAEGGGTATDHTLLTFDAQTRTITGTNTWTHTNGCYGSTTISGTW